MATEIEILKADLSTELPLEYADGGVRAGFPGPAQDRVDRPLDLNRELVKHPESTFYAMVVGDSMVPTLHPDDIMVIDRAIQPYDGCIAVVTVNGEFTVKELDLKQRNRGVINLIPHNKRYNVIKVCDGEQFEVWGIVRYVIHETR